MGVVAAAAIPELVIPEIAAVSALPEIAAAAIPAVADIAAITLPDVAVSAAAPLAASAADIVGPLAASALPAAAAAPSVLSDLLSNLNPISSAEAATIPTSALPTATPLSDTAVHPGLTAASSLNTSPASITPTPGPAAAAPSAPSGVPTDPASTGGPFTAQDSLTAPTSATDVGTPATSTPSSVAPDASSTPGSTGGPATGGPTSASDFSGKAATSLGSDAMDFLKKNPGAILSGGGALLSMLMQPKFPSVGSSLGPLSQQAANLNAQGSQLQSYLQSGQLPPGVQQGLDSAAEAAKAAIRSKYAAMGGGAETSSAAVQDIANVDVVKETQGANIALSLLQQGVSETQLSSQLYTELLNATLANDQQLSSSIGNFASSLVPKTTVINTGSTASSG